MQPAIASLELVERILGPAMPATPEGAKPERRPGVVIGIGLNGNMDREDFAPELRPSACSLSILQDGPVDRSEVARDLIRRLDRWYGLVLRQGVGLLSEAWRTRSEHLDRLVKVSTPEGPARGRLLSLDLQSGLTLEPQPGEGASNGEADRARLERIEIGRVLSLEAD